MKLKYPPHLDIIRNPKSSWYEFENNFEEGWTDEPHVNSLADHEHHLDVAALAATNLSKIWPSETHLREYCDPIAEKIIQAAYDSAAKALYPNERLWSGDHADDPDFWYAHISAVEDPEDKAYLVSQFWSHEIPFDQYVPKLSNILPPKI